jgi:methylmalonyl-CoA mutase C-terminal domain/subunit
MEVIYTGLRQTPEQVAEAAVQEDVDVVALSLLSGAHMTLMPKVVELLKAKDAGDIVVLGGGVIPPDDAAALKTRGVREIFGPGTTTDTIVEYVRKVAAERGA